MTSRRDRLFADRDPHQQLADAAERLDAAFECIAQLRAADRMAGATGARRAMTPTPETEALRLRVLALRAALIAHELRDAIEQYVINPTPIGWIEAEQIAIRLKRAQEATT